MSSTRTPELPLARQLARSSIVDARHLGRRDRPGADAQEAQHVLLQLGGLVRRDLAVGAVAEAGRDAVDRDLAGDQAPA